MLTFHGNDGWPLFAFVEERRSPFAGEVGTPLVLLHGGGPDHEMFVPLADALADLRTVVLPDVRGYGRSVCTDPAQHTWSRYAEDVISLLDDLRAPQAIVGGAGLGATIALRTAVTYPARVLAMVLISVEDIEDDEQKVAEIAFMDAFARRAQTEGLEAAWEPVLPDLAPLIGALVREAMPRSTASSIAAAAAIGRDRSFRTPDELASIAAPTLIFPGMDERHPAALAEHLARLLPRARLAPMTVTADLRSAEELAYVFAPSIRDFLIEMRG